MSDTKSEKPERCRLCNRLLEDGAIKGVDGDLYCSPICHGFFYWERPTREESK